MFRQDMVSIEFYQRIRRGSEHHLESRPKYTNQLFDQSRNCINLTSILIGIKRLYLLTQSLQTLFLS